MMTNEEEIMEAQKILETPYEELVKKYGVQGALIISFQAGNTLIRYGVWKLD